MLLFLLLLLLFFVYFPGESQIEDIFFCHFSLIAQFIPYLWCCSEQIYVEHYSIHVYM